MTQEQLTMFASVALSLALAYIPGLKDRYDALDSQLKATVMAGLLLLVVAAVFGLTCGGFVSIGIVCSKQGLVDLASVYIFALIANQGTYLIGVRPFKK